MTCVHAIAMLFCVEERYHQEKGKLLNNGTSEAHRDISAHFCKNNKEKVKRKHIQFD